MKRPQATVLLVSRQQVGRWDLPNDGATPLLTTRAPGSPLPQAVAQALALGDLPGPVWIFADELFADDVTLSPPQVAGLTQDQLARALAFEIEPFSGIPLTGAALGFREKSPGVFTVIEGTAADREEIRRVLSPAGSRLAGMAALPVPIPDPAGVADLLRQAQAGRLPTIRAAAPTPWKHRHLAVGAAVWLAAVGSLLGSRAWQETRLGIARTLTQRHAQLAGDLQTQSRLADALRTELATLEKRDADRRELITRRMALAAALRALAILRSDDTVLHSLTNDGPSTLIVHGYSVDAGAADELSIVLSQRLKPAGWTALPRSKSRIAASHGTQAWEFSLQLIHDESTRGPAATLSQRNPD